MTEMSKREISMMMAPRFEDPWLNITIAQGRNILINGDEGHEPIVAAYADRLGFSVAQATDLLQMIRNRETDRFLASCSEWRSGEDAADVIAAEHKARVLYGHNEH